MLFTSPADSPDLQNGDSVMNTDSATGGVGRGEDEAEGEGEGEDEAESPASALLQGLADAIGAAHAAVRGLAMGLVYRLLLEAQQVRFMPQLGSWIIQILKRGSPFHSHTFYRRRPHRPREAPLTTRCGRQLLQGRACLGRFISWASATLLSSRQ